MHAFVSSPLACSPTIRCAACYAMPTVLPPHLISLWPIYWQSSFLVGLAGVLRHSSVALDRMPPAGHMPAMATLQVKNVPETLHPRLRRYAPAHQCTLSDVVLIALEGELARHEWHERLAQRPTTALGCQRRRCSNRTDNSGKRRSAVTVRWSMPPPQHISCARRLASSVLTSVRAPASLPRSDWTSRGPRS